MSLSINGHKITFPGKGGKFLTFKLMGGEVMQELDLTGGNLEGTSKAIFPIEGDILKLAFPMNTALDRPKEFDTTGTNYISFTCRRENK